MCHFLSFDLAKVWTFIEFSIIESITTMKPIISGLDHEVTFASNINGDLIIYDQNAKYNIKTYYNISLDFTKSYIVYQSKHF